MKHSGSGEGRARQPEGYALRLTRWLLVFLVGCALISYVLVSSRPGPRQLNEAAVPSAFANQVTALGLPNARFWAWYDLQGQALVREWEQSLDRERATAGSSDPVPSCSVTVTML